MSLSHQRVSCFTNRSTSSGPSGWSCCTGSGSCRYTLPPWRRAPTARSPAGCRTASSGTPRSPRSSYLASQRNLTTEEEEETLLQNTSPLKRIWRTLRIWWKLNDPWGVNEYNSETTDKNESGSNSATQGGQNSNSKPISADASWKMVK